MTGKAGNNTFPGECTIPYCALDRAEGHKFPAEFAVPSLPCDSRCLKAGLQKEMQTYEAAKEGKYSLRSLDLIFPKLLWKLISGWGQEII